MPLSAAFKQAVFAPETGEAFILLLAISHAQLSVPIRVAHNGQDVTSRGNVYAAYPFQIDLPAQDPERPPRVRLLIDNVGTVDLGGSQVNIVRKLREISSPPTVTLEVVLASAPDTVEAGPFAMTLTAAPYDALAIEGELAFEDVLHEPFPGDQFTPANFPGLF